MTQQSGRNSISNLHRRCIVSPLHHGNNNRLGAVRCGGPEGFLCQQDRFTLWDVASWCCLDDPGVCVAINDLHKCRTAVCDAQLMLCAAVEAST
jgi:hypothetical protein